MPHATKLGTRHTDSGSLHLNITKALQFYQRDISLNGEANHDEENTKRDK